MKQGAKAKKKYRCDRCHGIIRVGNREIGIEYVSLREHLNGQL